MVGAKRQEAKPNRDMASSVFRNRKFRKIARLPRKKFIGQAELNDFLALSLG